MVDVELTRRPGRFKHRLLGLLFAADEEDLAFLFGQFRDEVGGLVETAVSLLQVDDVDAVGLALPHVAGHLVVQVLGALRAEGAGEPG